MCYAWLQVTASAGDTTMTHAEIKAVLARLGLSIKSEYKCKVLNDTAVLESRLQWLVDVYHNDKRILTTDYHTGIGHCPSYKWGARSTVDYVRKLKYEIENGVSNITRTPLYPDIVDVIHCLLIDSDVLTYSTFEAWADAYGYNPDSIRERRIYRKCIEQGLALRNSLGHEALAQLQVAYQDY